MSMSMRYRHSMEGYEFIVPTKVFAISPLSAANERFRMQIPSSRAGTTAILVREKVGGRAFIYPVLNSPRVSDEALVI